MKEKYQKIDGYTEFFSFFFRENDKEKISKKLWEFAEDSMYMIDEEKDKAPSSTLNKYTKYTKNKDHKSKNILFNYQVSHVFGKTLNCYAFTAPWNIVYLPKVLDPFTGHESKGELTEQFTEKLQEFVKLNYREQIREFNKTMEDLAPKVKQFKKEIKKEGNIKEDTLKQFFKSLDESFSKIDL